MAPGALKTLLGREVMHAFFDARRGFDVAAMAALSGTLRAGSWLVLLTPPFADWPTRADEDSLRWSDTPDPIVTPNFVHRCCRQFIADPEVLLWRQSDRPRFPLAAQRPDWHPADGRPQAEQAAILEQLIRLPPGIAAVTAERGRGKSALAGMLLRQLGGEAIVTAPTRSAVEVLASFAGETLRFMAPDALLASKEKAAWLIVDEAAAIPAPLLRQLVSRFPRTLLTTTVQGYEGTGRGFLLKFCASLPHLQSFTLSAPIRWAAGCPLESAISQLLIFNDEAFRDAPMGEIALEAVNQSCWQTQPALPGGDVPAIVRGALPNFPARSAAHDGCSGPGFPLRSRRRRGSGRPVAGGRGGTFSRTEPGGMGGFSPAARESGRPVAGGARR
ncbi:putative acyl-CoA N-acyltransferase [Klebsiella pneumoniae]|uniref:Putative acyl-CoA N-acyltransferase n=1 Tax=Klebsiella pneumoniae TaxID=573 RepID=A0A377V7X4_KLEPN|nr:putative acyl-CoA N-acyltransferase [Klebsiella pneumoniae]